MELVFLHTFESDLKKLKDKSISSRLKEIIILLENSNDIRDIENIKNIKGSKYAYRLRINDYRLGFYYEKGVIELCRFVHRKDIYKLFP